MRKVERLKEFVLNEREALKEGVDIPIVKKHYRKAFNFTPDKTDIIDALIELRKEGYLKNNLEKRMMFFTEKQST